MGTSSHVFYDKLNVLLGENRFDDFVETLCEPFYAEGKGRDSIPPGAAPGKGGDQTPRCCCGKEMEKV